MAKILVVDDDEGVRESIIAILRNKHQIENAADIKTAREILENPATPFDLVLADSHLPDGNGGDLIGDLNGVPLVIMFSAMTQTDQANLKERGVTNFLTKGEFTAPMLEYVIKNVLRPPRPAPNMTP